MHWDGSISVGNIIAMASTFAAILLAFNRFVTKHNQSTLTLTNAINNLAAITERLQKAIEAQDQRLTTLETEHRIESEVQRRIVAITQQGKVA